jgi:hypothetical protein
MVNRSLPGRDRGEPVKPVRVAPEKRRPEKSRPPGEADGYGNVKCFGLPRD